MTDEVVLGVYDHDKDTTNTRRFKRTNENGRTETIYVPKDKADGLGDKVEVVIRPAS